MSKHDYLDKAIDWVSKKSSSTIKSKSDGFEEPKVFRNKSNGAIVQADFSFETKNGAKSFTEIALKSETPQKLVTRWKLLSLMASIKNGRLHLLAPKGHKTFTQRLIDKYNINASVHSL